MSSLCFVSLAFHFDKVNWYLKITPNPMTDYWFISKL